MNNAERIQTEKLIDLNPKTDQKEIEDILYKLEGKKVTDWINSRRNDWIRKYIYATRGNGLYSRYRFEDNPCAPENLLKSEQDKFL